MPNAEPEHNHQHHGYEHDEGCRGGIHRKSGDLVLCNQEIVSDLQNIYTNEAAQLELEGSCPQLSSYDNVFMFTTARENPQVLM